MILSKKELVITLVVMLFMLCVFIFGVVKPIYQIRDHVAGMSDRIEVLESMAHPSEKRITGETKR